MYIVISYVIQCLYSPTVLVGLYSSIMFIILILFKMLLNNPVLINRTEHCLACSKLYPENYFHCYKCHTCYPIGYDHVRMFRTCMDNRLYFIWNSVRNTLLFVFCVYNILYGFYTKVFVDLLLVGISLI